MPDDVDVQPEAIYQGGEPVLTRERAKQERERWTALHPPIPGLRWVISFGIDGQVRGRHLEVIPGWEDAYAPALATRPTTAARHDVATKPSEANRLGALAYQGWHAALPEPVRQYGQKSWDDVPEPFREPLRQAAVLVWQHGENAGFHEALLRTLPSAQLGAAGELEGLGDFIAMMCRLHGARYGVSAVLGEITRRVAALRQASDHGAQRAREQTT